VIELREENNGQGAQTGGKVSRQRRISIAEDSWDMVISTLICRGGCKQVHTSWEVASGGEAELIDYIFLSFFTHFSCKHILTLY